MNPFRYRAALAALLLAAAASFSAAVEKPVDLPALPRAVAAPGGAVSVLPGAEAVGPDALIPGALAPDAADAKAAAAASIEAKAAAIAPQLEAASKPAASDADAAGAAGNAQAILEGGKVDGGSSVVAGSAAEPGVSGLSAATAPRAKAAAEPPAPRPQPKIVTRSTYEARRRALSSIAETYGVVASLPVAGPELTREVLGEAAGKKALLSDIDDTLVKFRSGPLEPETVARIVALRRAGKTFAAVTDRPDTSKPGTDSAFDTLSSIPAKDRAGIFVSTDKGGKIYRYREDGAPELVEKEKAIEGAERDAIDKAAEATVARLESLGTSLVASKANEYGHVIIVKLGTPASVVTKVAEIFSEELAREKLPYEAHGQLANNPEKDAPYVYFSKLSKARAIKRLLELARLDASDVVIMGDSMYRPQLPKGRTPDVEAVILKAAQLSGRDIPETGKDTDRDMERAAPGALTLSVGGYADPRMANAFVLDGLNAPMARRVIEAMTPPARSWRDVVPALLIIAVFFVWVIGLMVWSATAIPEANRTLMQQMSQDPLDR